MNRLLTSIQGRVAIPFVCGMLLLSGGVVACSPPSDVTVQQPLAIAAQPAFQSAGDIGVSTQPFVAIAKQASFCRQYLFGHKAHTSFNKVLFRF